jgi:hypothetical protein
MDQQVRQKTPGRLALVAGLALAAVAATAFGVVRWSGAADRPAPVDAAPGQGPIPPIDAAQPTRTETATFAMG